MEFSHRTRRENLEKLKAEKFDLVIIGGGISGAGVARDAVSRGMRVALVEANDFASGTSSRSSKLIHGGIRYLENLEFGLVFEALTERRNLFEMAPHLVHPLRFLLPLYKGGRVGMFKLGLGMWLYDALSTFEAPQMHERLSSAEVLARAPLLASKDLLGGYVYSDAYMDDDRRLHG
jgi:glycerol-3-phosphate dehydrogenase